MTSSNVHRNALEPKRTGGLALRLIATALLAAVSFALTGCSGSFDPKLSGTEPATGASGITFKGHIQGGQAPIYDAAIYVFQTGESGYPSAGSQPNYSIITSTAAGTFNGTVNGHNYGPHVNTDTNGNFSFTLNNCTPGAGVYVVSYGGQPIFGTQNFGAAEMASMGVCPANSTTGLFAAVPFINVTEVSTVALAYAVGGFTAAGYDFSYISTSATNIAAMQNAFNLASQMFSVSTTGGANVTSSSNAGAIFNAALMNTMANILADCINSGGVTGSSSPCYILFQNATSNGTAGSGGIPGDTASAMINITHNLASNVAALYALASNTYSPYSPALTAQPRDLSNQVLYNSSSMQNSADVEIDSNDYVYGLQHYNSSNVDVPMLAKIAPVSGIVGIISLSGASVAGIDLSNNVFLMNSDLLTSSTSHVVSEYAPSATAALGTQAANSPYAISGLTTGYYEVGGYHSLLVGPFNNLLLTNDSANIYNVPLSSGTYSTATAITNAGYVAQPTGTAETSAGQIYYTNYDTGNMVRIGGVGGPETTYNIGSGYTPSAITIDVYGNGWATDNGHNYIYALDAAGSDDAAYVGGGLSYPGPPEIDGLNNLWVVDFGNCSLSRFVTTTSYNINTAGPVYPNGLAIRGCANQTGASGSVAVDHGGNLWVTQQQALGSNTGFMVEILGAAAPTIEPLSLRFSKIPLPTSSAADLRP